MQKSAKANGVRKVRAVSSEPAPAEGHPSPACGQGSQSREEDGVSTVDKQGSSGVPMRGRGVEATQSPLQLGILGDWLACLFGFLVVLRSWKQGQKLGKLSVTESWPSGTNC